MTEQQKEYEIVSIGDVSLRDGEQTPGIALMPGEKLEIARQLDVLGVNSIEAGFPATHRIASAAVTAIARSVKRPTIGALARAVSGDIYEAWESLRRGRVERPSIHVFVSSSEIHQMHQLRKDGNKVMEMAVDAVKLARSYCPYVEFSPMDATRTNPIYLYALLEAVIRAGATTVNITDTIGCATPLRFSNLIRGIFDNVPNIDEVQMSVHCHNDKGFATANSLAAVHEGVRRIEVTINGAGERAGNADLAQVVMGLEDDKDEYGCTTNIDFAEICQTSILFSRLAHLVVQPNTPYVGANAFMHESGIHQDGVLKAFSTYEFMHPDIVGWVGRRLSLGPTTGLAGFTAITHTLAQEMGITLTGDAIDRVFKKFQTLAWTVKRVTEEPEYGRSRLERMIRREIAAGKKSIKK